MSRSGYTDDCDDKWQLIKWRGQIASAVRGKRGQKFLRDLRDALDAMSEKALIVNDLETPEGVCAIGALGRARSMTMSTINPDDPTQVAAAFDIASQLAREIVYINDEGNWRGKDSPQSRWCRVRAWVSAQIRSDGDAR